MKTCADCKYWKQKSTFPTHSGGFPGICYAKFPLWVDYCWGPRMTDTTMSSDQNAEACQTFEVKANA
jgi:hypothetical protein